MRTRTLPSFFLLAFLVAGVSRAQVSGEALVEEPVSPTPTDASDPLPSTSSEAVASVDGQPAPTPGGDDVGDLVKPQSEPTPALPPLPPDAKPPEAPKPVGNSLGGFLDFNLYPYLSEVDSDSVFTLNAASKLPYGFSYASLLNIANQAGSDPFDDTTGFYTEQNLRWSLPAGLPFDLTLQYNMRSGEDNDRLRFGARVRFEAIPYVEDLFKKISLAYSITFHMLQIDHEDRFVWQMEHIFRLDTPYLDRRLYIAGFADHTFNQGIAGIPDNPVILEVQGGARLIDELYAIAEYRVNQYRAGDETNLALGGEYVIKW
jgi:hypothetical protein